jgi:hypothetical protein
MHAPTPVPHTRIPRFAFPLSTSAQTFCAMSGKSTGSALCVPQSVTLCPQDLSKAITGPFIGNPAWSHPIASGIFASACFTGAPAAAGAAAALLKNILRRIFSAMLPPTASYLPPRTVSTARRLHQTSRAPRHRRLRLTPSPRPRRDMT